MVGSHNSPSPKAMRPHNCNTAGNGNITAFISIPYCAKHNLPSPTDCRFPIPNFQHTVSDGFRFRFPISNTPAPTEFQLPISSSRVRNNSENVAHMKTYNYLYEKSTMSKVQSIYHIIISTYHRERTLDEEHRPDLFRYIWDFFKKRKCKLFRINGVSNHIHILVDIHPTIALSSLMRELKNLTSMWITKSGFFPYFKGWGKEYAAFSCSYSDVPRIIEYIKNQQAHHKVADFQEELKRIFGSTDMQLHENDLQ